MKFSSTTVYACYDSPLGRLLLAACGDKLVGVWFEDQAHLPDRSAWREAPGEPVLQQAQSQLIDYFAGRRSTFDVPLDVSCGTEFQQTVWRALLNIPHGATSSYGALSASIGKPTALRAVGGAIGRNPLSIVIPCHRVVGVKGALTGYAGGLARKTALLQLEGTH